MTLICGERSGHTATYLQLIGGILLMVLLTGHFIAQIVNYPLYAYVVNFSPLSRSRISGSVSSTIATAFSIDEYTQGFTRFVLFEVIM
ncbi:hypothetical protein AAIG39_10480 [Phytobacter palmae]|uniref:Uncharacterized protein n=1 Tax=Phytobacter palmae TaxID=1855371 RepID=A0ABU9V5X3_9ENTR